MLPLLLFGVIGLILLMVLYVYPTFIAPMFEEESLPEPQSDESLKLTVVANVPYHIEHGYDAGAANFFGIARVDGEKLESGDFVCIAGDQYVVQSVNSHSEQIDYVYLDRILVRSVPVGTNVTIGQCPSQPA